MTATLIPPLEETKPFTTKTMRATVFHGPGDIRVEEFRGLTPGRARR